MRATDDCHRHLNNSHPRFVRLPSASQSFLCWFPVKVTLVHQVHRTFHDAPYASATRAVFSWRIVPRVRRFRDDVSGRHLLESASDIPVASSPPSVVHGRNVESAETASHELPVKGARFPRSEMPSLDRSELHPAARRPFGLRTSE